jgi:phosphoketolase
MITQQLSDSSTQRGTLAQDTTQRAGLVCSISAAILVVGCLVTQWQAMTTTVSNDAWRFPWSPSAFIATTHRWASAWRASP